MEFTKDQKNKLSKLQLFANHKELAFFQELQEISQSLKELIQKEMPETVIPETKFPDVQTVRVEGLGYLKGEQGDSPTDDHLINLIQPLIPSPVPGRDGYTPQKGIDYRDGTDAPPVDEQKIVDTVLSKIPPPIPGKNADPVDEDVLIESIIKEIKKKKLIDISDIKNSGQFMYKGTKYNIYELMHGGGSSTSSITYSVDLSAQCNGSNKVFTVPTNTSFILLTGTDAPLTYRPVIDYTGSGTTTLTLDVGVNAPSSGATLILTYVN